MSYNEACLITYFTSQVKGPRRNKDKKSKHILKYQVFYLLRQAIDKKANSEIPEVLFDNWRGTLELEKQARLNFIGP